MKTILLWALTALCIGTAFAQQTPNWQVEFEQPVKWYHQSSTGVLIVHSGDMLHGIDPEKQKETWRIEGVGNIKLEENTYAEVENTPYIKLNGLKSKKKISLLNKALSSADGRNLLIDVYQGKIIYDSDEHPISLVQDEVILNEIDAMFLLGKQAAIGKGAKKKSISLVSLKTGKIIWNVPVFQGLMSFSFTGCRLDPRGNLLISAHNFFFRVNVQDGSLLWRKPYTVRRLFFDPNAPDKFFGQAGYNRYTNAFDLHTGNPLWFNVQHRILDADSIISGTHHETMTESLQNQMSVLKAGGYIVADEEEFMATGYASFNFYDYQYAKPRWEKPVNFGMKIHEILPQEERFLVKLSSNERWHISYCNNQGEVLWDKPTPLYGEKLYLYIMTPHGIVYMTNRMIGLLDTETGQQLLPEPIIFKEQYTPYIDWERNKAFVFQSDKIYEIDFATKTKRELLSKIKFKGDNKAFPHTLERVGNDYFLANDQNMLLFDGQGQISRQEYYRYPGVPMWLKRAAGTTARIAIAAALLYVESAGSTTVASGYFQGEIDGQTTGELLHQLDLSNQDGALLETGNLAWQASYLISRRKSSAYRGQGYQLILTKLEDGRVGLLKIDKATGDEITDITLKDRNPDYFVDDYLGILFYQPDKKTIYAYELEK